MNSESNRVPCCVLDRIKPGLLQLSILRNVLIINFGIVYNRIKQNMAQVFGNVWQQISSCKFQNRIAMFVSDVVLMC